MDGTLRLVGSNPFKKGRIEMFLDGEWGTICKNGWDDTDAGVACRQLGFGSSGSSLKQFGQGNGIILMENVACLGNESMLINCSHKRIGISACSHSDDVGVVCSGDPPGECIHVYKLCEILMCASND